MKVYLGIYLASQLLVSSLAHAESKADLPSAMDANLSTSISISACEPAEPRQYLQLCNHFTTENGTIRCIEAGQGRHFDACVLDLCNRFNTEDGTINCLLAGRDKDYADAEIEMCNRFTTESGAVGCLRSAGTAIQPHNPWRQEALDRALLIRAHLNASRVYDAERVLNSLIDWLALPAN